MKMYNEMINHSFAFHFYIFFVIVCALLDPIFVLAVTMR